MLGGRIAVSRVDEIGLTDIQSAAIVLQLYFSARRDRIEQPVRILPDGADSARHGIGIAHRVSARVERVGRTGAAFGQLTEPCCTAQTAADFDAEDAAHGAVLGVLGDDADVTRAVTHEAVVRTLTRHDRDVNLVARESQALNSTS